MTDESVFLERHQRDQNLLVVQCEDEIASINMAVGAAHMGVRSATATSVRAAKRALWFMISISFLPDVEPLALVTHRGPHALRASPSSQSAHQS